MQITLEGNTFAGVAFSLASTDTSCGSGSYTIISLIVVFSASTPLDDLLVIRLYTTDESYQPLVQVDAQLPTISVLTTKSYFEIPLNIPLNVLELGTTSFVISVQSLDTVLWSAVEDMAVNHLPTGAIGSAMSFVVSIF